MEVVKLAYRGRRLVHDSASASRLKTRRVDDRAVWSRPPDDQVPAKKVVKFASRSGEGRDPQRCNSHRFVTDLAGTKRAARYLGPPVASSK
jgi:hypothetical protein